MILFLDSSAIVKLYADEEGSAIVRAGVQRAAQVVCHVIAYVEIRAALARKHRLGDIDEKALAVLKREFGRDWPRFERVAVTEALVHRAAELAETHAMTGFDSVHLAAAEMLSIAIGANVEFRFAVFDRRLRKAATAMGLHVLTAA